VFDDKSRFLDRFGLLLALTVVAVAILGLVDLSQAQHDALPRLGSVVSSMLVAATLLLALRASGLSSRWQRLVDAVVSVGIAALVLLAIAASWATGLYHPLPAPILVVVLAACAPVVIVRRLVEHRVVTRGTLLGAIAGYLLIGVMFYFVFLLASEAQNGPFFGVDQPTTSFMYFSLVSVTTVGYGDLVPNTSLDRLLANAEAVIGQVYLVTFVAMIVGLYASQRHTRGDGGRAL
jgi:hypothetical protein